MPVEGLVAFRANEWRDGKMVSPIRFDFQWNSEIIWADCTVAKEVGYLGEIEVGHPFYDSCRLDIDGHIIPGVTHGCGIWGTLVKQVYMDYARHDNSVLFLVEHLGSARPYTEGWRASGGQLLAIVNTTKHKRKLHGFEQKENCFERRLDPNNMSQLAAKQTFHIPVIELDVALEMIRQAWVRHLPDIECPV